MNALLAPVPRRFRFESSVAFRHLWYGGSRTLLPVSAVAAGVIIVIFITSLIFGLQDRTIELLTEAIPHVTIQAEEPHPMPLAAVTSGAPELSSTRIEQQAHQRKFIDNWLASDQRRARPEECENRCSRGTGAGLRIKGRQPDRRDRHRS